jgi:hypothetical protein
MEIQAVSQGTCTECGSSDDNWSVNRDFSFNGIDRRLTCGCGAFAVVRVCDEGLVTKRNISHADASWNDSDE